ncbi:MAG: hypothetical protein ACREEM_49285, partial [Blastocatellia bacterium]
MATKAGSGNAADLIKQVITEIDAQISELTTQRAQLAKMVSGNAAPAVRRRGRPPAAAVAATTTTTAAAPAK